MEDQSFWVMIPAELVEQGNSTKSLLYGVIWSYTKTGGVCFASNKTLASKIGRKDDSIVSDYIIELEKEGWLHVDIDQNGGNKRIIRIPLRKKPYTSTEISVDPSTEKTVHSIISRVLSESKEEAIEKNSMALGKDFESKKKPQSPRGWANLRRRELGKEPIHTPRTGKQDEAIKALKMKDYFREQGFEQHGMQFFKVESKTREAVVTKLVINAYKTLGEKTKDLIDWWFKGDGEWADYEPEQCFSIRVIERFLNKDNRKNEPGILGLEKPVEKKTRVEELKEMMDKWK